MLNLPLILRPGRLAISLFAALSCVAGAAHAQVVLSPHKTEHYRPFALTSSKLKREKSDAFVMDKLMCRSTLDNMVELTELVQNFDLVRTNPTDGSLSLITFLGRQGGQVVGVSLAVQTADRVLAHVMVDGQVAITCR